MVSGRFHLLRYLRFVPYWYTEWFQCDPERWVQGYDQIRIYRWSGNFEHSVSVQNYLYGANFCSRLVLNNIKNKHFVCVFLPFEDAWKTKFSYNNHFKLSTIYHLEIKRIGIHWTYLPKTFSLTRFQILSWKSAHPGHILLLQSLPCILQGFWSAIHNINSGIKGDCAVITMQVTKPF